MNIDFNKTEISAMNAFAAGNEKEGEALQDQFLEEIRKERKEGTDFCPCPDASCKHHGICWECVQIHRGHGMHLPFCMQKMVNRRLAAISELTEHTIVNEVSVPEYLRKPGTDSERSREGA